MLDKSKNAAQCEVIVQMLTEGPKTSLDFIDAKILRYSARIHELRGRGYSITGAPLTGRVWEYTL